MAEYGQVYYTVEEINKRLSAIQTVEDGGSGSVTKQILPNIYYKFGEVTNLTITLGAETTGISNQYRFKFISGATPTTLSLPASVKYPKGRQLTVEANTTYEINIEDNLLTWEGWDNV